jgi:peptide/nickel transport system substrate-binding protein
MPMKSTKLVLSILILMLLASMLMTGCAKAASTTSAATATAPTTAVATKQPTPASTTATTIAPTKPPTVQPQYGGTLRLGEYADANSLYPITMRSGAEFRIASPALETLLRYDEKGNLVPLLAAGVTSDVAAKTITLTLREGVKFHDGTPFNAAAVKWYLDLRLAKKAAGMTNYTSIDVIDDHTVRINLTKWDACVLDNLAGPGGMIISPTAYQVNGEQWCINNPVGTGPFKLVSRQRDAVTVYKKNNDYWQKSKPYLDGIEFHIIADAVTRELSFRARDIDVISQPSPSVMEAFKKEGIGNIRILNTGGYMLGCNSVNPDSPFSDVNVRKALAYAIDREAICQGLFLGYAKPSTQYVYENSPYYNPSVTDYPYDVTQAKKFMQNSKYPNGFDTVISFFGQPDQVNLMLAVQENLKAIGINMKLDPVEVGKAMEMQNVKGWDSMILPVCWSGADTLSELVKWTRHTQYLSSILTPDDVVQTAEEAAAAPDFKTKQEKYQELMTLIYNKYYLFIPLVTYINSVVVQTYVHDDGLMVSPALGFYTPEDAWLEK